ncbi:MAG: M23 family metallopeptidase [Gemmatimonadaceae bacterium]|nr:M23 family metallopeptidase [Gemmatimonadaceae bacterium]MDQ3520488.1 M23 family metallopeptidase [Gemmatimonadota bacterium]
MSCNRSTTPRFAVLPCLRARIIGLLEFKDGDRDSRVLRGFPDWQTSPYVLPYAAGTSHLVDQANCSPAGNGHRGTARYGYDFLMPIGTRVTAARGGVVVLLEESHFDGEIAATGKDNYLYMVHDDGTGALYGHFTNQGIAVDSGQTVLPGMLLGFSGNTGNTANKPHLHLSVFKCNPVTLGSAACPTAPFTFRNTDPNPQGLQRGQTYAAH